MPKYRQEKVAREVMRVLSSAIFEDAKDARLLQVSITNVNMSSDLSVASIHWLCPKDADKADIARALVEATPYLRSVVADEMDLRRVPNLKFYCDESYENGLKMDELLAKLRAEGQMGSGDGDGVAGN